MLDSASAPPRKAAQSAAPRFDNVNLLRAFAALAVVVYHVIEHTHWSAFPQDGPLATFRIGWIGVDLFFVISGFVITYSALVLFRDAPRDFTARYWARRITRIVPLYLLTMAAWIVFIWPGFFLEPPREWGWQLLTHLTFTHSFFGETHSTIDGVNWTLGIEMQFYLAVALLIRWIDRTPAWRIVLCAVVVSWAWRAGMVVLYAHTEGPSLWMHVTQLPGSLDEFGAGIFLAKWVLNPRRRGPAPLGWLIGAVVAGYAAMAVYWERSAYWEFALMVIFWRTALALFLVCVVALAVDLSQAIARRWLRPLDYLGDISYGIYLWHLFAVQLIIYTLGMKHAAALVGVLAMTILLAACSWRYFEKPIMELARR